MNNIDLFLDSGAFTAFTKGSVLDICEYTKYALKNKKYLNAISTLDDIESWEKSLENLSISDQSITTIPCFHYGEPFKLLEIYVRNYEYISLGGLIVAGYTKFIPWLDNCFKRYICDKSGYPKVKVHGFAITSQPVMFKYPWYSVDSSTWIRVSRMGMILMPKEVRSVIKWDSNPIRISVSDKGPMKNSADMHVDFVSSNQRDKILKYIDSRGFKLGKSDKDGNVIEKGLCNSYRQRDRFNLLYMLDLEEQLPKWPSKMKSMSRAGFI